MPSGRLFNTLVVMGAGLAANCGGESRLTSDARDPEAGSGGGGATGGGAGAGAGSGGITVRPMGGMAGTPTPWLPSLSESAQWDCRGQAQDCSVTNAGPLAGFSAAVTVTEPCPVDAERPRSVEDCEDGETLRCHLARTTRDEQFLVNCECAAYDGCASCQSLTTGTEQNPVSCTEELTICPCAYTGILK